MSFCPCARQRLKIATLVMTVLLLYVFFNRVLLPEEEIKVVTVTSRRTGVKLPEDVSESEEVTLRTTSQSPSHSTPTSPSHATQSHTHPLSIPPHLAKSLPKKFKHDSCKRLPSDRLSPTCPFCSSFNMDVVTIYWDYYEKSNTWLSGSVERYIQEAKNCKLPFNTKCVMNHDNPSSDAIVKFYTAIDKDSSPSRTCFPQIIISMNSEAEHANSDRGYAPYTEVAADYHLRSEIKLLYSCWNIGGLLKSTLPDPKERAGVAMFVSNCKAKERIQYLQELMKYIRIDSYGNCLHNTDKAADRNYNPNKPLYNDKWAEEMMRVSSKYRMVIAYENSFEPEYFSEKVFYVLRARAIPVFRGPPEIYEQIPGNNTIINIDDYKSPEQLALYMKRVLADDDLFLYHVEFDEERLNSFYRNVCNEANQPVGCQMCNHVYQLKLASYKDGGRPCHCPS